MSLQDELRHLEASFDRIEPVIPITTTILSEALGRQVEAPADIERARKFLGSAFGLARMEDEATAREIMAEATQAFQQVQQWLTVTDFGITPLHLRTYMEKHPLEDDHLRALIQYYLAKMPRAHNDRDKLDYLLLEYFQDKVRIGDEPSPAVLLEIEEQFELLIPPVDLPEPSATIESKLSELYGLRSHLTEFADFDRLVQSRLVERARALKLQLGESFFHPSVLPRIIHFNLDFRRRFDNLFRKQIDAVQETSQSRIEEAWRIIRSIEEAYETLEFPELARKGAGRPPAPSTFDLIVGRELVQQNERIPLDRLCRSEAEMRKETELRGILGRIACFVAEANASGLQGDAHLDLRQASLALSPEERDAFKPCAEGEPPRGAQIVQLGLGLVAWIQEEKACYHDQADDKYGRKPHFDLLSHAVSHSIELLHNVRELIQENAEEEEAAWFGPLVKTSLRLGETLNRVLPIFEKEEQDQTVEA